jgi:hypothetical protein
MNTKITIEETITTKGATPTKRINTDFIVFDIIWLASTCK